MTDKEVVRETNRLNRKAIAAGLAFALSLGVAAVAVERSNDGELRAPKRWRPPTPNVVARPE
jgi:hypothetical protein